MTNETSNPKTVVVNNEKDNTSAEKPAKENSGKGARVAGMAAAMAGAAGLGVASTMAAQHIMTENGEGEITAQHIGSQEPETEPAETTDPVGEIVVEPEEIDQIMIESDEELLTVETEPQPISDIEEAIPVSDIDVIAGDDMLMADVTPGLVAEPETIDISTVELDDVNPDELFTENDIFIDDEYNESGAIEINDDPLADITEPNDDIDLMGDLMA